MAKRKSIRRRPKMKVPLLPLIGVAIPLSNIHRAGSQRIHGQEGYLANATTEAGRVMIGIDRRYIGSDASFDSTWMWGGTFPLLIALVGSKVASMLGANRLFKGLPVKL